jgi:hypothetical protein
VSLAKGLNETLIYVVPFEKNEEVITSYDADAFMEKPSLIVDYHIDDFICIGRRRWDMSCYIVYRDLVLDIEIHS